MDGLIQPVLQDARVRIEASATGVGAGVNGQRVPLEATIHKLIDENPKTAARRLAPVMKS